MSKLIAVVISLLQRWWSSPKEVEEGCLTQPGLAWWVRMSKDEGGGGRLAMAWGSWVLLQGLSVDRCHPRDLAP